MNVKITNIKNGSYDLIGNNLYFDDKNSNNIIIDKKSALEIMETLLDSINLLTKENEELIEEIESRLENG